MTNATKDDG